MKENRIAIFGYGEIGKFIVSNLSRISADYSVFARTDRQTFPSFKYFNAEIPSGEWKLKDLSTFSHAIICFGISGIRACSISPVLSHKVNVTNTISLLEILSQFDVNTLYYSTSLKWDYQYATSLVESHGFTSNITTLYAQQKYQVERFIMGNLQNTHIATLGKVVSGSDRLLLESYEALHSGKAYKAASNVYVAPVHISSIYTHLKEWLAGKLDKQTSILVPKQQSSYYELILELSRMFNLGGLVIPDEIKNEDEHSFLPSIVCAPNSLDIWPHGIYGVEACKLVWESI
jgi:dTDP-4-dehydrorhamnose reductase